MNQKLLLISLGLLFSILIKSQVLNLRSGDYRLSPNISFVSKLDLKEVLYNNYYITYIHFSDLPSAISKAELKQKGVVLEQYITNKTYQAKISSSINDFKSLVNFGITGIYAIDYKYKLQSINQADWDVFQPENDGIYTVTVMLHQSIDEIEALTFFNDNNIELLNSNLYANYFTVKSSFEQIEELAKHPMVLYIEPKDLGIYQPKSENMDKARFTAHGEYPWVHANRVNLIRKSNSSPEVFNGEGLLIALGVDSGISPHYDLKNRVDQSLMTNFSGKQSTQSAGIIAGAGNILPGGAGIAPKADLKLYNQWDAIDNYSTAAYPLGIDITTTTQAQSCLLGYNTDARLVDMQLNGFEHLMHIFNEGNRQGTCSSFQLVNQGFSVGGGYQNSKNALTAVATSRELRLRNTGIPFLQAIGPTSDYRMKPDITVDYNLMKTLNGVDSYDINYQGVNNTISPHSILTGIYALLFQYYQHQNNGHKPHQHYLRIFYSILQMIISDQ